MNMGTGHTCDGTNLITNPKITNNIGKLFC